MGPTGALPSLKPYAPITLSTVNIASISNCIRRLFQCKSVFVITLFIVIDNVKDKGSKMVAMSTMPRQCWQCHDHVNAIPYGYGYGAQSDSSSIPQTEYLQPYTTHYIFISKIV